MWKRTEFRYETMMSMAMYMKTGVWRLEGRAEEEESKYTEEDVIRVFQKAFSLTIAREASGNRGFNPNGSFSSIILYEDESGRDFVVRSADGGLQCLLDGLFDWKDGKVLCFNTEGQGLDVEYFKYMLQPCPGYVSVPDLLEGNAPDAPNVRRFYTMLYARPFVYIAHLADKDGVGLLEYDSEIREKAIRAAEKLG